VTPEGPSSPDATLPISQTTDGDKLREGPGSLIGPYKILQLLGEGGFGSVFMAEQERPVRRRVALKIIKLGMDTRQVVARFEQERQALAILDHPNIAKVFDAGATETGRPFFVMELCTGEPIDHYCDRHRLSIQDRLELFAQVCQAVQHAHTKGLIHRDIKPSNVLVSLHDGKPQAKVIDFGIAKATASKLTEKTLFTEQRQLIGTPEYMSPEQAEGSLDIDTRTDVYSLGVLLYELLTGSTPFTSKELRSAAHAEIQRIIREVEPPKPSTRLSHDTDNIASVAAQRHTEPKKLSTIIRGELDWIVMKALEKDRQRRYETANGLVADIRRYLSGEAVLAAPPSRAYRMRKFVRRNRGPVAATLLVAMVLMLGVIGTSWGMAWAVRERDKAQESAKEARTAAEHTRRTSKFLTTMLASADPHESRNPMMTVRELLDEAAMNADTQLRSQPEVQADVLSAIGAAKLHYGQTREAVAHLEKALQLRVKAFGPEHVLVAESHIGLAWAAHDLPDFPRAEAECRTALEMQRRLLGDDDPAVAESLAVLGDLSRHKGELDAAEKYFNQALAIFRAKLGDDAPDTWLVLNDLAVVYKEQSRFEESQALIRRVVDGLKRVLGKGHPSTVLAMYNLADALRPLGRTDEADEVLRQAIAAARTRPSGESNPNTLKSMQNLAEGLRGRGRMDESESLFREAVDISQRNFGDVHRKTVELRSSLGVCLRERSKFSEADPVFAAAVAGATKLWGPQAVETLRIKADQGFNLGLLGRDAEGIPLLEEAYAASKEHKELAWAGPTLLDAYSTATSPEQIARARALAQELVADVRASQPKDSPELGTILIRAGYVLLLLKQWQEAEPLLRESLTIREATKPEAWSTFNNKSILGEAMLEQGKFAEAEPLLLNGYAGLKDNPSIPKGLEGHDRRREALERIVRLYDAWDKAEPGQGYDAKAADWKANLDAAPSTPDQK
jgi:serine/threonine protein kinase/tetratricopeptide (TPR) repeat protein